MAVKHILKLITVESVFFFLWFWRSMILLEKSFHFNYHCSSLDSLIHYGFINVINRMSVCAKSCINVFRDILCFVTRCCASRRPSFSFFYLKADNSSVCLIFITFRQPVNLDSCCIWAAPSSRFTSDTLFVWRRASCGSLWPERSSFESSPQLPFNLFFFLSSRLATRLQIQPPGGEHSYFSNSHHLGRQMQKANSVFFFLWL